MGIFNFIKNMGWEAKGEKDLQNTLNQAVNKAGLNLRDFKVDLKNSEAFLSGFAGSIKDLELARLIVGNYKGVEKVNDDKVQVASQQIDQTQAQAQKTANAIPTHQNRPARMVTVQPGDTLSKIAKQYLGDSNLYHEIFEANRPMIKDPDEIFPGQVIRIPDLKHESKASA